MFPRHRYRAYSHENTHIDIQFINRTLCYCEVYINMTVVSFVVVVEDVVVMDPSTVLGTIH